MEWKIGGQYTVIGISEMLALTTTTEVKIARTDENGEPIFTLRGKRTLRKFKDGLGRNKLVFEEWDIPLKVDSEQIGGGFVMHGNACFNFLGSAEDVRKFIDGKNLNEYFSQHDAVLAHGERAQAGDESAAPVYPEVATEHAVVKRIREKRGTQSPEVVSSYSRGEAMADGVLMENPGRGHFYECDIVTTNLNETLKGIESRHCGNSSELALLDKLMGEAKQVYASGKFSGDNDKDFFVVTVPGIGIEVWFVRNENARLTAMLPEDY